MAYKHGAYGELIPTQEALPLLGAITLPVYIGTAPIDTLESYESLVNAPIMVYSYEDAKEKLGYSDDWEKYTLCEAMYAHFKNSIENIGPIILINVLDPKTHIGEEAVAATDIIGGIDTDGNRTGLAVIDLIYQMYGRIPSIIAAPGWSHNKDVETAMVAKCQKINGHWDTICVIDLDSIEAKTLAAAKILKETNEYKSRNEKVFWPKVKYGNKEFWLSTIATVRMQQTDYKNDNIPFESPSNKPIMANGTILADGVSIQFDEQQANTLNEVGITTAIFRGGNWVLWGPHNANYKYNGEIDIRDKFDAGIRMMMYLSNSFQQRYMSDVDGPLNRSKVDTILNDSQVWLNSLVGDGKLLFAEIQFLETSNPVSSIVEGDFIFDIKTTTTPVGKSLTFRLQYTAQGINTLFGGETA